MGKWPERQTGTTQSRSIDSDCIVQDQARPLRTVLYLSRRSVPISVNCFMAYVVLFSPAHSQSYISDTKWAKLFLPISHRYIPGDTLCTSYAHSLQPWPCPSVDNVQCRSGSPQHSLVLSSALSLQVSMRESLKVLLRSSLPTIRQVAVGFLLRLHCSSRGRWASLKDPSCTHVEALN